MRFTKIVQFGQKSTQAIWEVAGGVNVRTKILGIVLGGTLLLSLGLTLQMRVALAHIMEQELRARGVSIGRDLAARSTDLILINDLYALQQLMIETQANNPNVRYAFLLDPRGQVLAHTFGSGFPEGLAQINTVASQDYQHTVKIQTEEGIVWDVAVPVFEGRAGTARVGISSQSIRRILLDLTSQVLLTTLAVLGLSLLAAAFLTIILTRPIIELVEATRAVARGDFSRRVRRWANDEIGELAEAFNQMTSELSRMEDLRRERELLRRQLLERVITAQEEERKRIARELHDSTSQTLTSLLVGLRMMETNCVGCAVHNRAQELRQIAAQTLDEVHDLAMQLRPRLLDDLGLAAALRRLVNDWQARHQIMVDVLIHLGDQRLPSPVETALYRIVQETLTNVARHAQASSVSVLVERRGKEAVVVVEDDGVGFNPGNKAGGGKEHHLGILGMRERAELLGGHLTIESAPGAGTSVFVQIPIEAEVTP